MTERFSAWEPLADPAWGTADMAVWRPLLESESQRDAIFQVPPVCRVLTRILCCDALCCAKIPVPTICAIQDIILLCQVGACLQDMDDSADSCSQLPSAAVLMLDPRLLSTQPR